MSTICLTGGGSGGHIIPALALVPELKKHFSDIIFIGIDKPLDRKLVEGYGIPFFAVESAPFSRGDLLKNFGLPFQLSRGISASIDILKSFSADVVFMKGGYASLPAALAAKRLSVPLVVHESDYTLGLANRLASGFADKVLTSFPETRDGVYVGNPVREEILRADKSRARARYGVSNMPVISVVGGSQGAEAVNRVLIEALPRLKDFEIIHVAGKGPCPDTTAEHYRRLEYADDIFDIFALSDVVVSRAGANTLFELAAMGKRTVAVPLPRGSHSRGDQQQNARSFASRGYVYPLEQKDLTPDTLVDAIRKTLRLPSPRPTQIEKINENVVSEILSVLA